MTQLAQSNMKKVNKKAHFNYLILERFEAGVVLMGGEVKSVRKGNVDLGNSFAKVIEKEVYLINANIPIDGKKDYNSTRIRKLLLNRKEITTLESKIKAKKLTLVPISVYTKGRLIKVQVGLAKSKRKFEKKESIKKKDIQREIERTWREKDSM
jgi:SsrA-binding protein